MTIKQLIARAGLALLLSCLWLAGAGAEEQGKADVVLRNGKIYTADPARSIKQAIAFSGNTILVVGDDSDMEKLIGPRPKSSILVASSSCPVSSTRISIQLSAPSTAPNAASLASRPRLTR
jgi:hypothetical protein